jgi:hypothetical protein
MRYRYLGDRMTDPMLVGQECDPVRRADGKCIISVRMATALVVFPDGLERVVLRRRLRLLAPSPSRSHAPGPPNRSTGLPGADFTPSLMG